MFAAMRAHEEDAAVQERYLYLSYISLYLPYICPAGQAAPARAHDVDARRLRAGLPDHARPRRR